MEAVPSEHIGPAPLGAPQLRGPPRDAPGGGGLLPSVFNMCTCGSRDIVADFRVDAPLQAHRPAHLHEFHDEGYRGLAELDFDQVPSPWAAALGQSLDAHIAAAAAGLGGDASPGRWKEALADASEAAPPGGDGDAQQRQPPPIACRATFSRASDAVLDDQGCFSLASCFQTEGDSASAAAGPTRSVREAVAAAVEAQEPLPCDAGWLADEPACAAASTHDSDERWVRHVAAASVAVASTTTFVAAASGVLPVAAAAGSLGFTLGILSSVLGIRVGRWVG